MGKCYQFPMPVPFQPYAERASLVGLSKQSRELRGADCISREDGLWIIDAEMAYDDLAEHVAEIGCDGKIAALVTAIGRETRPLAVHASAAHSAADDHHHVTVTVIGSAVAVLVDRPSELGHRQNDRVTHSVAEIGHKRGNAAREVV